MSFAYDTIYYKLFVVYESYRDDKDGLRIEIDCLIAEFREKYPQANLFLNSDGNSSGHNGIWHSCKDDLASFSTIKDNWIFTMRRSIFPFFTHDGKVHQPLDGMMTDILASNGDGWYQSCIVVDGDKETRIEGEYGTYHAGDVA